MKKNTLFVAILLLVCILGCTPKQNEKKQAVTKTKGETKGEIKTRQVTKAKTEHTHTDGSEQSACPICNAKLLIEKGYREITTKELEKLQRSDETFILINVLEFYYYRGEHILNSISIPLEQVEDTVPKLFKKDVKIVTYCQGYHCTFSTEAAEKLVELGYTKIFDYKGGMDEWKAKGNRISGIRPKSSPKKK